MLYNDVRLLESTNLGYEKMDTERRSRKDHGTKGRDKDFGPLRETYNSCNGTVM